MTFYALLERLIRYIFRCQINNLFGPLININFFSSFSLSLSIIDLVNERTGTKKKYWKIDCAAVFQRDLEINEKKKLRMV